MCGFFKKDDNPEEFFENVALCDESVLNDYLNSGSIETDVIKELIASRELFPCFFGSALKMTGVKELLEAVTLYAKQPAYTREFGARVFKIARDEQGARLTYMKLTGGILKNKELLSGGKDSEKWSEKVNQIRIYSGEKYTAPAQVQAGVVCAVTGLTRRIRDRGLAHRQGRLFRF